MKTILKIILVQLCCFPLFVTEAMARDSKRSPSKAGSRSSSRPTVRPSKPASRNPITQSKAPRPAPKPSPKPISRPQPKPVNRPQPKPVEKPKPKPIERPQPKPIERPQPKPVEKPKPKPIERPQTKPIERPNRPGEKPGKPGNRPNLPDRPQKPETRPETKPGHVVYPKPGKPDSKPGRPSINRPDRKPEVKPGKNTKPVKRPDFDHNRIGNNSGNNSGNKNNWWNNNKNSNNRTTIINQNKNVYRGDRNIEINNNFKKNVNWSTNRKNWGYNPWWNRPATRPWYGGSWNCGWNRSYYNHHHHYHGGYWGGYRPWPGYVVYDDDDNDVAEAIGWGLVGWGLGKLIFDSGYQAYTNPYPVQPVPASRGTQVTYSEPITVVAAQTAPAEEESEKITESSESFIASSQEAFKQRDYLKALDLANKAVAEAPGDGALHEYRALVLFALGKYSEAAGVLNPVLAGGPGWDWTTMISIYDSQETYTSQLESLQNYSRSKPDAADARFLLGYHQMVCGRISEANAEFAEAARLQPADSVSSQLRDLTAASSNSGDEDGEAPEEEPREAPPPVPLEKLTGTWVSDKGAQGTVTLAFKDDGKFIWNFTKAGKSNEFGGEFSMNDNGLLVLDADESQMVASVELPQDGELKFILAGGPPGDPGLVFARK